MKKIIALIMVVMMAMLPMLSMAEEQQTGAKTTTTLELNSDIASMLFGEENGPIIAALVNNMTSETTITTNGGQAQIKIAEKLWMDGIVEVDNGIVYLNSNVLPYVLKLDFNELSAGAQENTGLGALAMLGSMDLSTVLMDVMSIQFSFENTMAAVQALYGYMTMDQETGMITADIPVDVLCSVINAIVSDVHASAGLSNVVGKYFGVQDFDAMADQVAAQLNEMLTQALTGNITFVMDGSTGDMSVVIPTAKGTIKVSYVQSDEDGYINLMCALIAEDFSAQIMQARTDGQSVATIGLYTCTMGEEGITVNAAPFEMLIQWSESTATVAVYANGGEIGNIAATKDDNGFSVTIAAQDQVMALSVTSDGEGKGTVVLNFNGVELKAECTVVENTVQANISLNGTLVLVVRETIEQIAAEPIVIEGKDAAVSVLSLFNDQEALTTLQQTVTNNMSTALQECFQ